MNLKLQAAYKLLFLFNEGIDIEWAAFNIIELMAANKIQAKRISYTLAVIVFQDLSNQSAAYLKQKQSTELHQMLTLTPNVFRKDFQNIGELNQKFGASLALNCLSKLCNEELA